MTLNRKGPVSVKAVPNSAWGPDALARPPRTGDAQSRDRWLLMRLLAAVRSEPRLSDRLLAERPNLGGVLALSDERLRQLGMDDNGITIIRLLGEAVTSVTKPSVEQGRRMASSQAVVDSLFAPMAWLAVEQVRAVFLDAGRGLIRSEILGTGSIKAAAVYPREVVRRALELNAAGVILVHNHPSGDPTPSQADYALSHKVAAALATVDVDLVDHVVIARSGWASAMPRIGAPANISTVRISTARPCAAVADGAE